MVGIESFGYYLPRYSIRTEEYVKAWGTFAFRGVEEKTVPGYDEDELTMAVEAARRALDLAGEASGQIDLLVVASASAREPFGGGLAEALGLLGARVVDATGPSAGVAALASAFDLLGHRRGAALVASADAGRGTPADPREHALGAGAAAFVLSPRGGVEPVATASRSGEDYGGTPRDLGGGAGGTVGGGASLEALRGALGEVLKGAERRPLRLAVGEEDGRFAHEALGPILAGEPTTPGVVRFAGYTGASGPLLNLVVALGEAQVGEEVAVAGHGRGPATAMLLRVASRPSGVGVVTDEPREDRRYLTYQDYLRLRGYLSGPGRGETGQGAYVPLPQYQASIGQRYRLEGRECGACGAVAFPAPLRCPRCSSNNLAPKALKPVGHVHTFTIIGRGAAPGEFLAQQEAMGEYAVAIVELEEGPRITAQLTDVELQDVRIGMPATMVLRRLYRQEGVVRYGFKFKPSGLAAVSGSVR